MRFAPVLFIFLTIASGCSADSLSLMIPPLRPFSLANGPARLGLDEQLWGYGGRGGDRAALLQSLDRSIGYLRSRNAEKMYASLSIPGVTLERVQRSLARFRELVVESEDPFELQRRVRREFEFFRSVGKDGQGSVKFTGYYAPVFRGSRVRTAKYRYPLYKLPADFFEWTGRHPGREQLEGADGLTPSPSLRGRELVFLENRLDAFLVHVQGSTQILLDDGSSMSVGFAGATKHPFVSIGQELVRDKKMRPYQVSLDSLRAYFDRNPEELDRYLPRNDRFVFFKDLSGSHPRGSLGVEVTAERSIATDKSMMPPGALALIATSLPFGNGKGGYSSRRVNRFVLDQDTGSAIRSPGRVDVYMGIGDEAGRRAGRINTRGELYYLLLKG